MKARQMTFFFHQFFEPYLLGHSFLYLKILKIHFQNPFLICKIPDVWR